MGTRDGNRIDTTAKNPVRPRKGMAEGGCGGNSAIPFQKIEASPAALLVQSRTQQKSFLFLLEEKIRRAQIRKSEENFFAGWRVVASGGGLASLVPFKVGSREVYNYSTMMLVKVRVSKSLIEGLGLFAAQFIPKGTKTWEFSPDFDREFTPNQFKSFPLPIQEFLNTYAYISPKTGNYILPADDERFTNHSDHPNTASVEVQGGEDYDIAARDIQEGEEITTNYNLSAGKIDFEVR